MSLLASIGYGGETTQAQYLPLGVHLVGSVPLGSAVAALGSHATFRRLKRDGDLPLSCRLQVCLPTPLAPISAFVSFDDQAVVEPAYEAAIKAEVAQILEDIPHDQLAVQWDTN